MPVTMKRFEIGESGWEVEWCSRIPIDDNGDADIDGATTETRDFRSKDEAMEFAKKIYPLDEWGAVSITPFTIEPLSDEWPYGRHKVYTADSDYYEGEK